MTATGESLKARVDGLVKGGALPRQVARRLFLYDFHQVFIGEEDRGFSILEEVRQKFNVPFSALKIAGSAQFGFSAFKNLDFVPGESDLDLAIISAQKFQAYGELVYMITKRYSDLTGFAITKGVSDAKRFRESMSQGFFRPDLMPKCAQKDDWFHFFDQLSVKHTDLFGGINAGIYMSETFFEIKTSSIVEDLERIPK